MEATACSRWSEPLLAELGIESVRTIFESHRLHQQPKLFLCFSYRPLKSLDCIHARSLCWAEPFGLVKSTDTAQGRDALSYGFYFSVQQEGTRAPPVTSRFIRVSMGW